MTFDAMWAALEPVGRDPRSGGYRRYAWSAEDATLASWFAGEAAARGMEMTVDRAGNQWAWTGDPDRRPGLVLGSHLDSVPDGGAYDGPLGIVAAFAAIDAIREREVRLGAPIGVARFVDEEGARFGVASAGSRIITGTLDADRARGLRDVDGMTMAEAMNASGHDPRRVGPDKQALKRIDTFVELHVEQGRALAEGEAPVAVASVIWPHGRWRLDLAGEANHAGTTRLDDRRDPTLRMAEAVLTARRSAHHHGCLATVGKLIVEPNGVNAIASKVTAWLDRAGPARGICEIGGEGGFGRGGRRRARGVVHQGDPFRSGARRQDRCGPGRSSDPCHWSRPRRRDPVLRRCALCDALRAKPDGSVALSGRARGP